MSNAVKTINSDAHTTHISMPNELAKLKKKPTGIVNELTNLYASHSSGLNDNRPINLSRRRTPKLEKVRVAFQVAMQSTEDELQDFNEQQFEIKNPEELLSAGLNARVDELTYHRNAVLRNFEILFEALTNQGIIEERAHHDTAIKQGANQIANIVLQYKDYLSVTTSSIASDNQTNRLNEFLPTPHEQQGYPLLRLQKFKIQKESIEQQRQWQIDRLSAELNEVNRTAALAQQHADL